MNGIQVSSSQGLGPLQSGDNNQNEKKDMEGSFKNIFLQNHWVKFNQTQHKSSLREGDPSLLK
jgi:hypothetical protein